LNILAHPLSPTKIASLSRCAITHQDGLITACINPSGEQTRTRIILSPKDPRFEVGKKPNNQRKAVSAKRSTLGGTQDSKQNHPIILHDSAIIFKRRTVQWQDKESTKMGANYANLKKDRLDRRKWFHNNIKRHRNHASR
jgi:hypothetical protein